jgi:hypothetical protein
MITGDDPGYAITLNSKGDQRRVWDSNPRGRVNALAIFKTAAIGH